MELPDNANGHIDDEEEDILSKCLRLITDDEEQGGGGSSSQRNINSCSNGHRIIGQKPVVQDPPSSTPVSSSYAFVPVVPNDRLILKNGTAPLGKNSIIVCDICNKEFHTISNLKVHKKEIHGREREDFACADCGQVYTRLRSLERHQNKVHLKDTPQCRICRKKVVNFELHYRKFHCKSVSVQVGPRRTNKNPATSCSRSSK